MAKASKEQQQRLLALQELDTRLDQIAHQRAHHPVLTRLGELDGQIADLAGSRIAAQTAVSDSQRELTKAEDDVTQVRERAQRNQSRLDSGQVSAKDAQALVSELEVLARRQSELEDVELEIMERLESHSAALGEIEDALAQLEAARAQVAAERDAAFAELSGTEEQILVQRSALASQIEPDLTAIYERLRARFGGVAIAALRHGRSEASGLPIPAAELARIKDLPDDEIVYCEDTGRILVRGADAF